MESCSTVKERGPNIVHIVISHLPNTVTHFYVNGRKSVYSLVDEDSLKIRMSECCEAPIKSCGYSGECYRVSLGKVWNMSQLQLLQFLIDELKDTVPLNLAQP